MQTRFISDFKDIFRNRWIKLLILIFLGLFCLETYFLPFGYSVFAILACDKETNCTIVNTDNGYRGIENVYASYLIDGKEFYMSDVSFGFRVGDIKVLRYFSKIPEISYILDSYIFVLIIKLLIFVTTSFVYIFLWIFIKYNFSFRYKLPKEKKSLLDVQKTDEERQELKIKKFMNW